MASWAETDDRTLISVVIVTQGAGEGLQSCVESFASQSGVALLVVAGKHVPETAISGVTSGVELIRAPGDSFPSLARLGLDAAAGGLIAFTESHCAAAPDWAEQVRNIFLADPKLAILGGSVIASKSLPLHDRALYAVDYGAFARMESGESATLPGVNIVFRRTVLDASGWPTGEFWKSFASWELFRRGEKVFFDPAPSVTYRRQLSWPRIRSRRWHHGRCFGAMRRPSMTKWRRIIFVLAAPALPLLLTLKSWRVILGYASIAESVMLVPSVFVVHLIWIAGEWVGNLFGTGDSCEQL
ncbi:MAG: hypothetical protein ABI718_10835 [Acidobacteriota bacterium]